MKEDPRIEEVARKSLIVVEDECVGEKKQVKDSEGKIGS